MPVHDGDGVRPELARDRARQAASARDAVVGRRARRVAARRRRPARRATSTTWRRCATARATLAGDRRGRPPLLRDQGQPASGDPAHARRRRLRPGMRVAGRARARVRARCRRSRRERVLFTPSFAPRDEYEAAFARGVTVTARQRRGAAALAGACSAAARCGCAWTSGHGEGHHEKVRTGGVAAKFGLPLARFDEFRRRRARARRAASAACTRTWAAASTIRATGAACMRELAGLADGVGTRRDDRHRRRPAGAVHAGGAGLRPRRLCAPGSTRSRRRIRATRS